VDSRSLQQYNRPLLHDDAKASSARCEVPGNRYGPSEKLYFIRIQNKFINLLNCFIQVILVFITSHFWVDQFIFNPYLRHSKIKIGIQMEMWMFCPRFAVRGMGHFRGNSISEKVDSITSSQKFSVMQFE